MRACFLLLWTLLLLAAQMVLAERIALGGAAPDFLAILPVFVAMYVRPREAAIVGAAVGLVGDVLWSDRLGPMAVSLAAACALLASIRPRRARAISPSGALSAGASILVANLLYGMCRAAGWGGPGVDNPLTVAAAIAAYTLPMALLTMPAMLFTARALSYPARCRRPPESADAARAPAGPSGYPLNPRD